jgi:hypothetical protein
MDADTSDARPKSHGSQPYLLLGVAALLVVVGACRSTPHLESDEQASNASQPKLAHQIDGKISDWEDPDVVVADTREDVVVGNSDWDGPRDASLRVVSDRDERRIYFAAEVRDEKVIEHGPGRTDGVILWIAEKGDVDSDNGEPTVDQFAMQSELGVTFSPDGEVRAPRAFANASDSLETFYQDGIRAATVSTDRGYRVEVALKLGKIRDVGGIPIPDLSFRFQLVDTDEPTKPQALTSLVTGPIVPGADPRP